LRKAIAVGAGKVIWERSGHHFESIQVGRIFPTVPGPHILVDIDHRPRGQSPLWVLDAAGNVRGKLVADYCRHHELLDWTGDGYDEIFVADSCGVFDRRGKRIATLDTGGHRGIPLLLGDMTGDGISDMTVVTDKPPAVHIFKNIKGKKRASLGCGINYTLY
jgi:hypothetical protein